MTPTPTRILIVEDERIVARDIQRRLTRSGYDVVGIAGNGQQATQLARQAQPDLVLMDIHLDGDTDGVAAAETIRADSGTPIVYLTAYADEHTLARARVTEPFGYILKPFEERELRTVIEMALYRHGSEQRLRESERRYAVTLSSIGDGVIATDERGAVTFLNPVAETLTGWSASEAHGRPLDEVFVLVCEETGVRVDNPVARVLHDGAVVGLANHTLLVTRNGRRIPIDDSGAPIRGDDGGVLGAVLVFHDISERRRAEDVIRQAEEKYRSIFENAIEGMFQATADGRLRTANPALARICGYASAEELIASVVDLPAVLCADPARRDAYQRGLAEGGMVRGFETQAERKDRSRVWVSLGVRQIRDAGGEVIGYEGSVEEITERIHLEEQLRQSQKMEAIGRLAGGVAHDFNNMLTVILTYSDLLLRNPMLPHRLREDQTMIRGAAESAAALTRQLLMFGRKQARRPQALDLDQLVRDIERMLGRIIGENIALSTRLEPDLWPVNVDPGQMEQVIMNLAVNARDAMSAGGQLVISTRNVERTGDDVAADPDIGSGRYVVLCVEDNGCGMDAAIRARLFEPFFTTKEVGKGTGLGLATIYSIVKQSDGHIRVASEPGEGAAFTIWLPASADPLVRAREPAVEVAARQDGGTILVVDDDAAIRRLTRRVLEDQGYAIVEAGHGLAALELCRSHRGAIDLVLTDVVMPEMGGFALAERLRIERPAMPVVYMSGYIDDPEGSAPRRRAEDVLAKPFTPDELVAHVQRALIHAAAERAR